ncbi:protein phosphatase 2C domain-containing protein [Neobacillus rhizosphaerae]|uniref:protein phosphatase 2C domain-containing protein n=1 Tax=Neobacillus rhizosphaerae TaxID=2880965 RepID=UPI003D28731B
MNPKGNVRTFYWSGQEDPCINQIKIDSCEQMVLGRYGGNQQAGAYKNEDGALVMKGLDWEFAMILDGHNSAESVDLVINTILKESETLASILDQPVESAFRTLQAHVLSIFQSEPFLEACKQIQGETACLLCARKDQFVWWFSVGDCVIYLLHEELHKLGQYTLNQRQFYEWIGQVNTFAHHVPCYSSGVRELRRGINRLVMVTDGVLECGNRYYETPYHIYRDSYGQPSLPSAEQSVKHLLEHVHDHIGRDSATIICWDYQNDFPTTYPSNQPKR